jgi:hypothetical protein
MGVGVARRRGFLYIGRGEQPPFHQVCNVLPILTVWGLFGEMALTP